MVFKGKTLLGLDIGSHSIKMVDLKESKGGYELRSLGISKLPAECVVEKDIMDAETVTGTIRDLKQSLNIKSRDTATAISGHSVIVKKAEMPLMTENELDQVLSTEAAQHIPFDIHDVYLDSAILGERTDRAGMMDVVIVASKKEMVDDYAAAVRNAGLNLIVVDVDVFALQTMYEVNYPDAPGTLVALVDIGATMININIVKQGKPIFSRDISIGGRHLTERIQKEFGVSYEKAEDIKVGKNIQDVDPERVKYLIKLTSDTFVQEIRRTLDFFYSTVVNENIDRMYLCGGSANLPELPSVIEKGVGIPVEIINPFNNILWDEKSFDSKYINSVAPQMAVAVGLALRKVSDKW